MTKRLLCGVLIGLVVFTTKPAHSFPDADKTVSYKQLASTVSELINTYEKQLGLDARPFAYTFNNNEANQIYQDLLTQRGKTTLCEDSYLYKIKIELIKNGSNFSRKLLQEFLEEAKKVGYQQGADVLILKQSNLVGLKMLWPYLQSLAVMEDYNPDEEVTEDQEPEQEKEQDQTPPKWPNEPGDSYKPHTKDLGKEDGGDNKKKTIIAEVNFKTPVFGRVTYDKIDRHSHAPFQTTELPWSMEPSPIKKDGITSKYIKIYPFGEKNLKLFMPTGYIPGQLNEEGATITTEKNGGYRVHLTKDLKEVSIPLYHAEPTQLKEFLRDIYTVKVGISAEELPEKAQVAIIHKYDPKNKHKDEEVTKAIAHHLSHDYLYSSGARPETDLIDALKAGVFQCDMAAYIMTAMLRDIYKIPSRAVAGYRAKRANKGGKDHSYLVTPEEGHAWVEVFIDGTWRYFDPTPHTKDKEDDKDKKEKQEFSDQSDENTEDDQDQNDKDDTQEADKKSTAKDSENKDRSKYGKGEGDAKEEEQEKKADGNGNNKDKDKEEEPVFHPELDKNLADLLSEYLQEKEDNPLKNIAWKDILIYILNPSLSSTSIQNKIAMYEKVFENVQNLKEFLNKGKEIHKDPHAPIKEWLEKLGSRLFTQDINATYKELQRASKILSLYRHLFAKLESPAVTQKSGIIKLSILIEKHIDSLLKILDKFNSPDIALDLAVVSDFEAESPHLLWRQVKEKYGLSTVGTNHPTINLAADIRNGKLEDEKLINSLYSYTNFILNSSMKPGKMETKTWQQGNPVRGGDILLLDRPTDWRNAVLGNPSKDVFDNMRDGTAFKLTHRKIVTTESKKEQNEAERITIVGFDVSGSMSGDPMKFQAALITAFACRALDDVTKSGKHRHKVLLVPFDDKVGKPIKVNNAEEALSLISNRHTWLKSSPGNGGTDIQAFLEQALALIAEAQTVAKSPLDIANIILMSDGGSPVDYEKLKKARNAIHRDTPVQAMFIALGSTNPELIKFARDVQKMGMSSTTKDSDPYGHFTNEQISDLLALAQKNNLEKYKHPYYSTQKPSDIKQADRDQLANIFYSMVEQTKKYSEKTSARLMALQKPNELITDLSRKLSKTNRELHKERNIESWLLGLRQWIAKHDIHKDQKLFEIIAEDLMTNFEKSLHVKFDDLSHYELEELKHLLQTLES